MSAKYFWAAVRASLAVLLALALVECGGGSSHNGSTFQPPAEFLYSTSVNGIKAFPVNPSTGVLSPGIQVTSGLTTIGLLANIASDPTGKFLFVFGLGDSSIEVFSINATTGALTAVSGSPFPVQGIGAGNLSIATAVKFLYAATTTGITAFMVDPTTGTLSPIAGTPFSDGSVLRASVVDPSGKFLYASGNTTQITISVFTIDSASGALTPIAGSPFQSPINSAAYSIAVHPSGKFLYVSFPFVNSITAWSINPSDGALTIVSGSPFVTGNGVPNLLLARSGKFLYALNSIDATVSAFSVDANSGALTAVNGSPFPMSAGSGYLTIDPSGQFLYAANGSANTITGFNINGSTGALTAFSTPPFPAVNATLLTIVKTPH